MSDAPFRIGFNQDFLKADGTVGWGDIRLDLLDVPGVEYDFMPTSTRAGLTPAEVAGYDAIVVLGAQVTAETVAGNDRLALVSRFGVGYDNVDVAACTENGILVSITPDSVRRPVATIVLTYLLALSHRLVQKDKLTRAGGWADKLDYMGTGLTGKTVGFIGLGNIGREAVRLITPLEMTIIAADPYLTAEQAAASGATLVDLDTLLRTADFVVILCLLTPETHHLINAERLTMMKPTAYLINVARGPIVDQAALTEALKAGTIAGAGLDVFEQEPVDPNEEILTLENVIVSPHALCWTYELSRRSGESIANALLAVARGKAPPYTVNRDAIETAAVQAKLGRRRNRQPV